MRISEYERDHEQCDGVAAVQPNDEIMSEPQSKEVANIGGKREGAGRPAPLGRKETCSVRLTPDVAEFCRQHPDGFTVLEEKLRASKEFRDWMKAQN
jgi:hypothetical protein